MKYSILTRSIMIISGLILCLLPPAVSAGSTELVEPDPVRINCSLPAEKMEEGIKDGGAVRGWKVVARSPGNVELRYSKADDKHVITVNVSYTANTFAVTYKDSINLNYREEERGFSYDEDGDMVADDGNGAEGDIIRYLHRRPVGWMKNLSMDIQGSANSHCSK
jgi:hypothetical protein